MYNKRSSFIIHQLTGKINMGTEAATHQDLLFDFVRHCLSVYAVKAFRLLTYIKKRTDFLYALLLSILITLFVKTLKKSDFLPIYNNGTQIEHLI